MQLKFNIVLTLMMLESKNGNAEYFLGGKRVAAEAILTSRSARSRSDDEDSTGFRGNGGDERLRRGVAATDPAANLTRFADANRSIG